MTVLVAVSSSSSSNSSSSINGSSSSGSSRSSNWMLGGGWYSNTASKTAGWLSLIRPIAVQRMDQQHRTTFCTLEDTCTRASQGARRQGGYEVLTSTTINSTTSTSTSTTSTTSTTNSTTSSTINVSTVLLD